MIQHSCVLFADSMLFQLPVYTVAISGRFDVGGLASYEECDKYFQNKEQGC